MPIAAVPQYLGQEFSAASPALRFNMLLRVWSNQWKKEQNVDAKRVGEFGTIPHDIQDCSESLVERQAVSAYRIDDSSKLVLVAKATAPFVTGLGNEHPLENGFSFLNPYGLPYLPGSGVKGVLRRAAQELASGEWSDSLGWRKEEDYAGNNRSMIDVLFGNEPEVGKSDHARGALSFWDVIPKINGNKLSAEVMTPHQSRYYEGKESPHDSGSPNPIIFLTVPPGSDFTFHVICDRERLNREANDLLEGDRWKELLRGAFEHAFEWLGFGAKTSVGYGAMKRDTEAERKLEEERQRAAEEEVRITEWEQLDPVVRKITEIIENQPDKQQPPSTTIYNEILNGTWDGEEKLTALRWVRDEFKNIQRSKLGAAARKRHDERVGKVNEMLGE